MKRQNRNDVEELKQVFEELQEIKDSIEIIAREIVRQAKRSEK